MSVTTKKSASSLTLSPAVLGTLRPAKRLGYHDGASVTCLDFDDLGQFLLSSGVDKSIQLYDCHKGTRHKDVQSQKYGAHLARFAHHDLSCLYASTPLVGDDADHLVRHLSLASKSYLRYFRGHKDQVLALDVNPVADTFLSALADHTVKHWDLRTSAPTGSVGVAATSVVAFDPHGVVFAVGHGPVDGRPGSVAFYDVGSFQKGPFLTASVGAAGETWTKLEFGNNGKYVLVGTDLPRHYVVDALLGKLATTLVVADAPPGWMRFEYATAGSVCFTPDGKHVLAGQPLGAVALFSLATLKTDPTPELRPFKLLDGRQGVAKVLAFNPRLFTLASADDAVVLWTPTDEE